MKINVQRVVVAGCVGLAVGGWACRASASGFAAAHFGGEHGNVTEDNALSLYYNPAGIALGPGTDIYADGELAVRHATWDHPKLQVDPVAPPQPMGADTGNTGKASLTNVFGGPAVGLTHKFQLGPGDLAIGGGLFVPFGGRVYWDKNSASLNPKFPLATDGVQRWHGIDAQLQFIYTTLGVAYRLGPVSLGVAGNFIIESVASYQAHQLTGVAPDSTNEGRAKLKASGFDGSFGVGAMVEALPHRLWLAFSYQSQPGLGPQTLKGTLDYDNLGAKQHFDVDFHQALPDIYRAGARFRPSDVLELRLFGDMTRWSVMQSQCINQQGPGVTCVVHPDGTDASPPPHFVQTNLVRNWKDTYGGRVGGSYWVMPEIEVFAGAGYETGASPDATIEPATMDGDNLLLAVGGRFKLTEFLYVQASYTQLYFFDRTVTDSQLFLQNGKDVKFPTGQEDGNGTYTQWISVFQGSAEARF
jgi:long-chain fatty acid transport protein